MSRFKITDCRVIDLPSFTDPRGTLTLVDSEVAQSRLPFIPRRVFWIHDVPTAAERGQHAHRSCWELVMAISGSFSLTLSDGTQEKMFCLNSPNSGVLIPPMVWCRLHDFSQGCVCLTLASDDYDIDGYINDLQTFKSLTAND